MKRDRLDDLGYAALSRKVNPEPGRSPFSFFPKKRLKDFLLELEGDTKREGTRGTLGQLRSPVLSHLGAPPWAEGIEETKTNISTTAGFSQAAKQLI